MAGILIVLLLVERLLWQLQGVSTSKGKEGMSECVRACELASEDIM